MSKRWDPETTVFNVMDSLAVIKAHNLGLSLVRRGRGAPAGASDVYAMEYVRDNLAFPLISKLPVTPLEIKNRYPDIPNVDFEIYDMVLDHEDIEDTRDWNSWGDGPFVWHTHSYVRVTWRPVIAGEKIHYEERFRLLNPLTDKNGYLYYRYSSLGLFRGLWRPYELSDAGMDSAEDRWFRSEGYSRSARDAVHAAAMVAQTSLLRYEIADRDAKRIERNDMLTLLSLADHVAAWEVLVHQITHDQKVKAQRPGHVYDLIDEYEKHGRMPPGLDVRIAEILKTVTPEFVRAHHNLGIKVLPSIGSRIKGRGTGIYEIAISSLDNTKVPITTPFRKDVLDYEATWTLGNYVARVEFELEDPDCVVTATWDGQPIPVTRHASDRFVADQSIKDIGKIRDIAGIADGKILTIDVVSEDGDHERTYKVVFRDG